MIGAGHAAMHESVAQLLRDTEWLMAPETTFSIYGERGVVDVLAYHSSTGSLLVIELKTDLVDVQGLIGAVDRYRRLAPQLARERGWTARSVSCWVALRDTPANHRRLAFHATVLRTAFPQDGRRVHGWLRKPSGSIKALAFLSVSHPQRASATSSGVKRVRRLAQARPPAPNRHQLAVHAKPIGSAAEIQS